MEKKYPTRVDFAIIKVLQCIRSCDTYEQLLSCKQLIRLLKQNYNIKYLTGKYLLLSYKQKLYELREI